MVTNELLAASVHKTMIKVDSQLRAITGANGRQQFVSGGTTACFVLISQDDIMFVNVGDSRCVIDTCIHTYLSVQSFLLCMLN